MIKKIKGMVNDMELEKEILEIVCEKFELDEDVANGLDYNAPLFLEEDGGLGLDSIDSLELVVGIKEHFGIRMTDKDMESLKSIATIAEFIRKNRGAE